MLAELAARIGRWKDAENLLRRAVELAPGWMPAKANLALVLSRLGRPAEALELLDEIFAVEPDDVGHWNLKAATLGRIGDFDEAIRLYEEVLAKAPRQARVWLSYGHLLKTVGRQAEGIAAYRKALAIKPTLGEAWWSLANLKTVRFDEADIAAMQAAMARPDLSESDRLQLHFALGKAHEDAGRDAQAFADYAMGAALQRARLDYDPEETTGQMRRTKALLNRAFFAAHVGQGCPRPDPIFILGLPRAGSTLIEQILASHSQVEGTHELPHIPALAARLAGRARRESEGAYPDILAALSPQEIAALGEEYLARC